MGNRIRLEFPPQVVVDLRSTVHTHSRVKKKKPNICGKGLPCHGGRKVYMEDCERGRRYFY
jgi:hypothetical protein